MTATATRRKPRTTRPVEILDDDEFDALLRSCSRRCPSGLRDRALIALLAGAGLRIAEALALKPKDIDRKVGIVHVLRGKGSKQRDAAASEAALVELDHWLEVRKQLGARATDPVFCQITTGKVGKPIESSAMRHMFKRRGAKAGILKRVHPHALRHRHLTELVRRGVPITEASAQLGHANVATTNIYAHRHAAHVRVGLIRAALA